MDAPTKKVILITGASSGIGREYSRRFAGLGYDLIVTGRRTEKLMELARELKLEFGTSVTIVTAELSADEDVARLVQIIRQREDIHVLINNAGYGSGLEFMPNDIEDHLRMVQVHVIASLRLIHAVLPQMARRKQGTVINVSSLGAFTPACGSSMYSATKMFMKSITESLSIELHRSGIRMQCLCPGFTRTDFHQRRSCGQDIRKAGTILWMDAGKVVEKSLNALEKGFILCIPGILNKLIVHLSSLMPRNIYCMLMHRSIQADVAPGFFNVSQ